MKFDSDFFIVFLFSVALYARAWVEINYTATTTNTTNVALYARAWVEIFIMYVPSSAIS